MSAHRVKSRPDARESQPGLADRCGTLLAPQAQPPRRFHLSAPRIVLAPGSIRIPGQGPDTCEATRHTFVEVTALKAPSIPCDRSTAAQHKRWRLLQGYNSVA